MLPNIKMRVADTITYDVYQQWSGGHEVYIGQVRAESDGFAVLDRDGETLDRVPSLLEAARRLEIVYRPVGFTGRWGFVPA